jgi:hypothetical protein
VPRQVGEAGAERQQIEKWVVTCWIQGVRTQCTLLAGDGPGGSSPIRTKGGQVSTHLLSGDGHGHNLHPTFGNLFAFSRGDTFVDERLA